MPRSVPSPRTHGFHAPRRTLTLAAAACAAPLILAAPASHADELPEIPVGEDAYIMWDRWPVQRIGARAYMRATYDRFGGNRTMDASHYLYQKADDFNVTLDVEGTGILYFARYNHWHGSPWHYEIDGANHIIDEFSPRNPREEQRVEGEGYFVPREHFPNPITWTYVDTHGANLMWRPLPFGERFRMAYSYTFYGTGYYIYHLYNTDANLSRPIEAWDASTPPDPRVLDLLNNAGRDIAPDEGEDGTWKQTGTTDLPAGRTVEIARLDRAPAKLRALRLSVPRDDAIDFGNARLRVTWDDREHPSIDAPVALFFGTGTLYNRDDKEYLVESVPMSVRFTDDRVDLSCYFPMPYFRSATIELIGADDASIDDVRWELRGRPYEGPANHVGYFHATYRDFEDNPLGQDMVWLDTDEVEGGGPWSGHFVGTTYIFTHDMNLPTLEGDPRFFFDDANTPQAHGTGSEEWGGGGDYWGGRTMTIPLAGKPIGARNQAAVRDPLDRIHSAYRFLVADVFPFGRRAQIHFEHGATNNSGQHYRTVTYWYGLPAPSLVETDRLDVGDPASEEAHGYHSPDASEPFELTSQFDGLGPDRPRRPDLPVRADPNDYVEFEFEADAETYYIWLRGRCQEWDMFSDAVWAQFNENIGTDRLGEGHDHPMGLGNFRDTAWVHWTWSAALPTDDAPVQTVTFDEPGTQRMRFQIRQSPHTIDQIWLSTTQNERPEGADPVDRDELPNEEGRIRNIVLDASSIDVMEGSFEVRDNGTASIGKAIYVGIPEKMIGSDAVPLVTRTGRKTQTSSAFTLSIRPDNHGVLLRRTLDYHYPNQRARVYVAPAGADGDTGDFEHAGIWYVAGGTKHYHSFPRAELDPTDPQIMISPRRLRDDEFIIPSRLTQGHDRIRVRVEFTPVERPLLPGREVQDLAWTELDYTAYSWILPEFDPYDDD